MLKLKTNITDRELFSATSLNSASWAWARDNLDYLNKPMKLLTLQSTKIAKGEKLGYTTGVLYLQPADKVARVTLCPAAKMAGCKDSCLISSGRLGMTNGQRAATKRTILFLMRPIEFEKALIAEIQALKEKHGDRLAIRLNGTSDINWFGIIRRFPAVQFYDYTKLAARVAGNKLKNYHLTYSASAYSWTTQRIAAGMILQGHNVAMAFNTKQSKGEFILPSNLANFDETDLRFLDPPGTVGALTRKGSNLDTRVSELDSDSFFFTHKTYDLIATDRSA